MVSFKLFAGTNIGLRENNEDNFTVCPDLTKDEWIVPDDCRKAISLGKRGCLMVVADGMGGQNAGEVASAIAIDTIRERFSPKNMPADIMDSPDTIKAFLKKTIVEADMRVKKRTESEPDTYGMGSTVIMAWLIDDKVYIAWLGDSRAYSYIPDKGIGRLSKDHSYVQQLVDAGALTEEEAMNHPNSNVITRSLGDPSQKAKAEVTVHGVSDGEIILLCSDGLCGVCRDEEISGIISEEEKDLSRCKERLTTAALAAGGSDNITISLIQISCKGQGKENALLPKKAFTKYIYAILLAVLAFTIGVAVVYEMFGKTEFQTIHAGDRKTEHYDSITSDSTKYQELHKSKNTTVEKEIKVSLSSIALTFKETITYKFDGEAPEEYEIKCSPNLLNIDKETKRISLKDSIDSDKTVKIIVTASGYRPKELELKIKIKKTLKGDSGDPTSSLGSPPATATVNKNKKSITNEKELITHRNSDFLWLHIMLRR